MGAKAYTPLQIPDLWAYYEPEYIPSRFSKAADIDPSLAAWNLTNATISGVSPDRRDFTITNTAGGDAYASDSAGMGAVVGNYYKAHGEGRGDGTNYPSLQFIATDNGTTALVWQALAAEGVYSAAGDFRFRSLNTGGNLSNWRGVRGANQSLPLWRNEVGSDGLAQVAAANQPWIGRFPNGAPSVYSNRSVELNHNGAASDSIFLHDGSGCSLIFGTVLNPFISTDRFFWTADVPTASGFLIRYLNTAALQLFMMDGSGVFQYTGATAGGFLVAGMAYVITYRLLTNVATLRVNGTEILNSGPIGISAAAPPIPLRLGRIVRAYNGHMGPAIITKRQLEGDELALAEKYVARHIGASL